LLDADEEAPAGMPVPRKEAGWRHDREHWLAATRTPPYPVRMAFPIARRLLRFAGRARRNWLLRHQNAFNFWIHMIGIPLAFAGIPLLFWQWEWGVGAIAVGYLLQWVGHRVEGNDVGELIPLKRLLGLPAVSIAPQYVGEAERAGSVSDGEA
jgi:hypothetical protein